MADPLHPQSPAQHVRTLDDVRDIDVVRNRVILRKQEIGFDYLVIATGAMHSYFGHDDWANVAPGLKSIDDATLIRRRLLMSFERAEMSKDPIDRERLMRFVIVGGGPTGVELAGTIAELAKHTLAKDFRNIDPRSAAVILVEAGARILPVFHESLSAYAQRSLERLGVEVRTDTLVTSCDEEGVMLGDQRLEVATVLWAAGVTASPAGNWLQAVTDHLVRVEVNSDLSVPDQPNIFVIGDAARVLDSDGKQVPGIAPAAKQQGHYVAAVIASRIHKDTPLAPFHYRHAGNLATIGRDSAVIEFPFLRLKGTIAWWIWGIAHVYFLVGVPNPLLVSIRWLWEYITYGRGARLITGSKHTYKATLSTSHGLVQQTVQFVVRFAHTI